MSPRLCQKPDRLKPDRSHVKGAPAPEHFVRTFRTPFETTRFSLFIAKTGVSYIILIAIFERAIVKSTLVWALVFAPRRLVAGAILFMWSIYMLVHAPGAADNRLFVAAPYAFGRTPWFIGVIAGAVLVFWALFRGRAARARR